MRDTGPFDVGYVIACANIVNLHDEPTIAADVMLQSGLSWADVRRMGLTDYDMDALRAIKRNGGFGPQKKRAKAMKETTHD